MDDDLEARWLRDLAERRERAARAARFEAAFPSPPLKRRSLLRVPRAGDAPQRPAPEGDPACWSWAPLIVQRDGVTIPLARLERADQWDVLGQWHAGRCGICAVEGRGQQDHNHLTGKIRGYLCPRCNAAEGGSRGPQTSYARWRACASAQILGLDIDYIRPGNAKPVGPIPGKPVGPSYLPPWAPPVMSSAIPTSLAQS